MALKEKQKRFCEEYVIDLNATQAAIRAGYSEETAGAIGWENLKKPEIESYLKELQAEISNRNGDLAQKVIEELKKIGFSNIQDYIGLENTVKDLSEIDAQKAAAVSSIKRSVTEFGDEETGGTKTVLEFKLWDKLSALEKIGKHIGIFEADNKQKAAVIKVNISDE